mgnify:CR=1 FL=1
MRYELKRDENNSRWLDWHFSPSRELRASESDNPEKKLQFVGENVSFFGLTA